MPLSLKVYSYIAISLGVNSFLNLFALGGVTTGQTPPIRVGLNTYLMLNARSLRLSGESSGREVL